MNVFDFDNTIYDGESGIHLFLFYLKRHPSLIRHAPRVIQGLIDYKRHKISLDDVLERYADIFHEFLSRIQDFDGEIREFWDRHEHRLRPCIQALRQPGDLVISASPEHSLKEVCGRIGFHRYIGTRINEETASFDFICYRENKVRAFREQCPGEEIDWFFTDSMNDKPLMDIARHVVMVGKRGRMVKVK